MFNLKRNSVSAVLALLLMSSASTFAAGSSTQDTNVNPASNPYANEIFGDLPTAPQAGKCFAKCRYEDQYKNVTEKKLVTPASTRYEVIPAQYKTVTERVLVKEASERLIPVPAQYKTVTEKVLVNEAKETITPVPAKFKNVTERVMVKQASHEWVKKLKEPNCFSHNPEDCYIMCWEETPAQYNTITKQVLVSPASTKKTVIPAQYKTITKQVIASPATFRKEVIPAKYATVTKKVISVPASQKAITIPAQYKNVTERKLVKKAGYSKWTAILCAHQTNTDVIRQVQSKLNKNGYNAGPVDGVMGSQTKSAIKRYQVKNGLPVGNFNLPTLDRLNVQY